jgi:D-threo-aldose 1-dehydrogenase
MDELLPLCVEHGVDIVLGAPYESGILASDLTSGQLKYRYHDAPPDIVARARSIDAVCRRYDVPLKAAALQFPFGHSQVKTIIPGTRSPVRLMENQRMMSHPIPADLWKELKAESLIREDAPTP